MSASMSIDMYIMQLYITYYIILLVNNIKHNTFFN